MPIIQPTLPRYTQQKKLTAVTKYPATRIPAATLINIMINVVLPLIARTKIPRLPWFCGSLSASSTGMYE